MSAAATNIFRYDAGDDHVERCSPGLGATPVWSGVITIASGLVSDKVPTLGQSYGVDRGAICSLFSLDDGGHVSYAKVHL